MSTHQNDFLPEPLDHEPWRLFREWFETARTGNVQPNPDAMVVATVSADGNPSARVVLCRGFVPDPGYIVFYTNYQSRKGQELAAKPRAAAVIHWDTLHRQVRIEGPVVKSPDAESDAYFAQRPLVNRLSAWASQQSQPLASRQALVDAVVSVAQRFGIDPNATSGVVPRPPHWGGYRLWPDRIELWVEGPNRTHDRAVWTRTLQQQDSFAFAGSTWSATRLNP
jgi:pyridoxamine 5'-phosphate oxidase